MQILDQIDIDRLWREKDQILGEAVVKAEKAWHQCLEQYREKNINVEHILPWDIKCDGLMLDDLELRGAAAHLQKEATADDVWEEAMSTIISQNFVVWEDKLQCVKVDTELIRSHFNISVGAWSSVAKHISSAMQNITVLGKDEYREFMAEQIRIWESAVKEHSEFGDTLRGLRQFYEAHPELSQDLKWVKPKSLKISGHKCNGYRIDCFDSKGTKDYQILKKVVGMWRNSIAF